MCMACYNKRRSDAEQLRCVLGPLRTDEPALLLACARFAARLPACRRKRLRQCKIRGALISFEPCTSCWAVQVQVGTTQTLLRMLVAASPSDMHCREPAPRTLTRPDECICSRLFAVQ